MSGLHRKRKQLRRLKIRNITLNTVCILLAFGGISWTVNYFWKYVNYEITNDAVVASSFGFKRSDCLYTSTALP